MVNPSAQVLDVFSTQLGWMAIRGTPTGLSALTFGHDNAESALAALNETGEGLNKRGDWVKGTRDLLKAFSRGEEVDLSEIPLDLTHRSPFEQRVRQQLLSVSYGQTISYKELAEASGSPKAARAVGTIMAKNPIPLVIPCHRVLGSGGRLGGYSAPSGLDMKRALLKMERRIAQS
ncbi:methylated-DNA--[protein]-cysteine S-methyltransferase [Planctomicrobium sp. SH527]|uniref:methylated-DNA--[protein]-cysteine S-methyltransferase n=1 Tax=Planctomicrobium sp. SH527 TaxID=3448123 RepID=UPI003F5AFBA8